MILDEIIENTRREVGARKAQVPQGELEARLGEVEPPRGFRAALERAEPKPAIIAECKHASPSRGVIREPYDPVAIARAYEANGASAISVLTDANFFQGSLGDLTAVRGAVCVPVLRKDFIVDEYQVVEARAAGADCILLIACVLDSRQMHDLVQAVRAMEMDALVEVHHEREIEKAAEFNTGIIGVNNRNLDTLKVDLRQTERMMPLLPDDVLAVGESGIHSRDDLAYVRDCGVGAVLIGEHFMSADDPGAALAALIRESIER